MDEERLLDDSISNLQHREQEQIQELNAVEERISNFDKLINNHDMEYCLNIFCCFGNCIQFTSSAYMKDIFGFI